MQTSGIVKRMRNTVEFLKKDPEREYTATEIRRLGLLPWARDSRTIARILQSGGLKARVTGKDTQKRYLVKGAVIISHINQCGPVLMHTVRRNIWQKKKARKRR